MKAVVAAFNQEKALVGAFSVITNLRMKLFEALVNTLVKSLQQLRLSIVVRNTFDALNLIKSGRGTPVRSSITRNKVTDTT